MARARPAEPQAAWSKNDVVTHDSPHTDRSVATASQNLRMPSPAGDGGPGSEVAVICAKQYESACKVCV